MPGAPEEAVQATVARVRRQIREENARGGAMETTPLSMALGFAVAKNRLELKTALSLADERMYVDKRRQKVAVKAAGKKSKETGKDGSAKSIPDTPSRNAYF